MQANTYELKKILMPERRYVIPTFQRDYEWTEEGQWRLLFDDLTVVTERLSDAREQALAAGKPVAKADASVTPHFLGAVVCDQLPSAAGGLDVRAVIDGQQRLTTLQLLVRGVLDVLIELDSKRVHQVRNLIENPEWMIHEDHDRHKLWPRRKDRDVWPIAMADTAPTGGDHLYLKARRFFANSTRTLADDGGDTVNALVDALLDLFKLVVIDLEDNDDAQVIFEVLNGRQTPLTAADLVKNLLFLRGEFADEQELEKLYDLYWSQFDEDWWKQTVGVGHAARGRRDVLLSSWLTAVTGNEANVGHLYKEVRSYLDRTERSTTDVLRELHRYALAYRAITGHGDPVPPALARPYRRIDDLRIQTAVPVLLWLRTIPEAELPAPDHERAVLAMESWIFRRLVVGANTRGYAKFFVTVLRQGRSAHERGEPIAEAIIATLAAGSGQTAWPSDAEIQTSFANNRYYGWFSQERLRFILGTIDERLRQENPHAEPGDFDYQRLQIEHLLPQRWREHWPVDAPGPAETQLAQQRRGSYVDRIGNLTLVTGSFNASLSNSSWETKRKAIADQSVLQLNRPISSVERWSENHIDARASELAEIVCRIWPRAEGTPAS